MQKLGKYLWYVDTGMFTCVLHSCSQSAFLDSLIFDAASPYHPPIGEFLGEFKSEIGANEVITDFVACAHKMYSIEVTDTVSAEKRYVMKSKGLLHLCLFSLLNCVFRSDT